MKIITNTNELAAFCAECAKHDYVTIDTEFLRERSYYSKLCLIQMAYPGEGDENAVLIDPLASDLSLDPLYELFQDKSVVKVFHAARQDLEIFFVDRAIFPEPFFDTQVAAMVCGFGEQVGYETLVRRICDLPLDKSSRFTDWSARPLSDKQMTYALGDVTHLRGIYEHLRDALAKSGRDGWLAEELAILTEPSTYTIEPSEAWRRVKTRNPSGKLLAIIRELAELRETYAQTKNVPRSRVYKDDAMMEIASTKPGSIAELSKLRLLTREARKGPMAESILKAIARGLAVEPSDYPKAPALKKKQQGAEGLTELLRVLLKAKAEQAGVAQKLIATMNDLDEIAAGLREGPIFSGWRNEVFGADAARLCNGKVALSAQGRHIKIVSI